MSNDKEVSDAMDSLDDNDMERVERLILKLAKLKKEGTKVQRRVLPEKVAKQVQRANSKKRLDKADSDTSISKRRQRPRRVAESAESSADDTPRRGQQQKKQLRRHHAAREAIDLNKPRKNKFLEMQEASMHKRDTHEFDKKVNVYEPTPRMGRTSLMEVTCSGCKNIFDVSPDVVYRDPDTGKVSFTCNDCEVANARGKRSRRD